VSIPDLGPFWHKHTPQSYSASFKGANHLHPVEQSGFPVLAVHPPSFANSFAEGLATRQQRLWIKSIISFALLVKDSQPGYFYAINSYVVILRHFITNMLRGGSGL
jgi:hypothetical protein